MLSKKVDDFARDNANKEVVTKQDIAIVNLTNQYVEKMRSLSLEI